MMQLVKMPLEGMFLLRINRVFEVICCAECRCLSTNPQRLARWIGGESQWEELEKEMGFRKEGEGESS